MKCDLRLLRSQQPINQRGRLMGLNSALELRMLSLNKSEHEQHSKNVKHNYKLLEQIKQPDLMMNKEVRILEDLPLAVAVVAAVRTLTSATGALTRIKVLIQRIRPIGRTSMLEKSSDSSELTMNLISALPFGNCMSGGGMPAHHR